MKGADMPFLVRVTEGDSPRVIADNVDDTTAGDIARSVSAATGEIVELVPYEYDHEMSAWQLAEHATTTIGAGAAEPELEQAIDFEAMTGDELDAYAEKHTIDGYKKSASVADRRAVVVAWTPPADPPADAA